VTWREVRGVGAVASELSGALEQVVGEMVEVEGLVDASKVDAELRGGDEPGAQNEVTIGTSWFSDFVEGLVVVVVGGRGGAPIG